ncbi:MAG: ATP-dependent Clp protease ATP-binding subunit [Parcubacteria group bacterium]|nr:ATP-dependent Clp protease ATP-binding subunit [Parcubacteria group bacterium]
MANTGSFDEREFIQIMNEAKSLAQGMRHNCTTAHVLLTIINRADARLGNILDRFNVTYDTLFASLMSEGNTEHIEVFRRALDEAMRVAMNARSIRGEPIHFLIGIISIESTLAHYLLIFNNIDVDNLKQTLLQMINQGQQPIGFQTGSAPLIESRQEQQTGIPLQPLPYPRGSVLQHIAKDLVLLASRGELDPVIGRVKENPVYIGDAGVGKTAVVEGIATLLARGEDVPIKLKDKRILQLDLSALVSGTIFRGQFEERLQAILEEIRRLPQIVLFIDEFHTIVGSGSAMGSMDTANILKPALARGEVKCIGATTTDEYRRYIEKDAALERRCYPIMVNPPSEEDTVHILFGIKDKYEKFHNVRYLDGAIESAVKLSVRYINDRNLPDKAIDLLDESGSTKSMSQIAETVPASATAAAPARNSALNPFARQHNQPTLLSPHPQSPPPLEVTEEDVAHVVREWTGIPIVTSREEKEKLLRLPEFLRQRVIGQDEAIDAVSKSLLALKEPNRPTGSFIFLGPTGVGKTWLAKQLALYLFGTEDALLRFDMSEYQERHTVARLIGAPPGYVGYDAGGQLTEAIHRKQYAVILLDEIEKAHPDLYNTLLQVLDDGVMTDGQGRKTYFKNTIIIMTSNVPLEKRKNMIGFSGEERESDAQVTDALLKRGFPIEFINRLDDMVVFQPLDPDAIQKVLELQLEDVRELVKEYKCKISFNDEVKKLLLEHGFSAKYGARHMKRIIKKFILLPLGVLTKQDTIKPGDDLLAVLQDGRVVFEKIPKSVETSALPPKEDKKEEKKEKK